jgi:hypothetical protein
MPVGRITLLSGQDELVMAGANAMRLMRAGDPMNDGADGVGDIVTNDVEEFDGGDAASGLNALADSAACVPTNGSVGFLLGTTSSEFLWTAAFARSKLLPPMMPSSNRPPLAGNASLLPPANPLANKNPTTHLLRAPKGPRVAASVSNLKPTRVDWRTFVPESEVKALVDSIPDNTQAELVSYRNFIKLEYAAEYAKFARPDSPGVKPNIIQKLLAIDKIVFKMSTTPIKDARLLGVAGNIVTLTYPKVEESMAGDEWVLRCGYNIKVNDVMAFNVILRETQRASRSWPAGGAKAKGTKGITDALGVIGLGPHADATRWNVRSGAFRGFEATDPDNPWDVIEGTPVVPRETDGLYYKELCFSVSRLEKHVLDPRERVFKLHVSEPPAKKARTAEYQFMNT